MGNMSILTFKQKQEAVEMLFRQYHRAKLKLYCLENTNYYPELNYGVVREKNNCYHTSIADKLNQQIDDKEELKGLIASFDIIIQALSNESRLIIKNEYLLQRHSEWWIDYYSRATYYRLKTRALEEILFYVNIS